jgi:hypothetical protein
MEMRGQLHTLPLYLQENNSRHPSITAWMGSRAALVAVAKTVISLRPDVAKRLFQLVL